MKYGRLYLLLGTLILLFPAAGMASGVSEETDVPPLFSAEDGFFQNEDIVSDIDKTNPEFYHESEQLGQLKDITPPACSSPELYAKIRERILAYTDTITAKSTLAKRQKALILANLGSFSNVSVENFKPETDYNTANALIMIKINEKIPEKDIILCRQNQATRGTPLYVVVYPYADNYRGYIINLDKNSIDYKDISFIYP